MKRPYFLKTTADCILLAGFAIKGDSYEPVPDGMTIEQSNNFLGVQANFWSHIDRTEPDVDKQIYPRLLSIAEVTWSTKNNRDTVLFKRKIKSHLNRLEILGVNYLPDTTVIE